MSFIIGVIILAVLVCVGIMAYRYYQRRVRRRFQQQQEPTPAEMDAATMQSMQYIYYYRPNDTVGGAEGSYDPNATNGQGQRGVPLVMGNTQFISLTGGDTFPEALHPDAANNNNNSGFTNPVCGPQPSSGMHPYGTAKYLSSPPVPIQTAS